MTGVRSTAQFTWLGAVVLYVLATACSRQSQSTTGDTASAPGSVAGTVSGNAVMVRGTIASVSPSELTISSDTGTVTITLAKPVHVFVRQPGTIADVKPNSFVGVTSVKQPNGSERATEIHIFPEELRGLGEGSHMMAQRTGGGGGGEASRMTNGAVSGQRMTNGAASPSRMSNGSVASRNGSTLVVQYAGGSQTITVPPETPVTEIKTASRPLAAGDQVVVPATKAANGSLSADKVLLSGR